MAGKRGRDSAQVAVEVASVFNTGVNDPQPLSTDFSLDGLSFISSHNDDAVRLLDVQSLLPRVSVLCQGFGVHTVRFTQSRAVACVSPRFHLDGHLHLLNTETAQFFAQMAYLNDAEAEVEAIANTPVYSTLAQSPVSDIIASAVTSKGKVALFHPLISGAVAASPARAVDGHRPCLSFSPDGRTLIVGDDHKVALYDMRKLFDTPVTVIQNTSLFTERPATARCKGVSANVDGRHVLVTSSCGEAVVVDLTTRAANCTYYHNDARRHFVGSADAIGAQYLYPHVAHSPVVQLTTSMSGGRHLLVYHPSCESLPPGKASVSGVREGQLLYELQSKDSDMPTALAVNPKFSVVATAARHITWWTINTN